MKLLLLLLIIINIIIIIIPIHNCTTHCENKKQGWKLPLKSICPKGNQYPYFTCPWKILIAHP